MPPTPPEPVYQTYPEQLDGVPLPTDGNINAPPNTPASEISLSPRVSRRRGHNQPISQFPGALRLSSLNIHHEIDLRAITYASPVDENLMCAICRCGLIDPITTVCDHVFCRSCLEETLNHNLICPIDRSPLDREITLSAKTPKIILNQLDGLKAHCPECDVVVARSMLENHLEKYCPESEMRCPGKNTENNCNKNIKRKLSNQGCLHYATECPDCHTSIFQLDLESHRELICEERMGECENCGSPILHCKEAEHIQECPNVVVSCKWMEYGCEHESKRVDIQTHTDKCSFKSVGLLAERMKQEISSLQSDVRTLTETRARQDRRLKFLERGTNYDQHTDYADFTYQNLPNIPESPQEPFNAGTEYLLSMLEAQDSKLNQLEACMKELEAKQTTMLFNETIPIKYELNEIKNMQQTTGMHVRWLMNFRMKENQRRTGGGPGSGPSSDNGGGSSSDSSSLQRRLSDSTSRDIITKL